MQPIEYLKDKYGFPYGKIVADTDGRLRVYNYKGSPVGYYDPKSNRTFKDGIVVSQGNTLITLVSPSDRK